MAYEYLLASLPELKPRAELLEPPLGSLELFSLCQEEMSPGDFEQVRLLHCFNDIKNAVFFIFYSKQRQEDFASPSYYDERSFMALKENPGLMLPFLQVFYELKAKKTRKYPQLPEVDELTALFYEHLPELLPPGFLRSYLEFTAERRNIASALAFRRGGLPISSKLVPWGEAFEIISRNEDKKDFGLTGSFPWVQKLSEVLDSGARLDFELRLDDLLWDWLAQEGNEGEFSLEAVLAYFIRLASIERFQKLTQARGRGILDGIRDTVQRSIAFSLEFSKTGDR